MWKYKNISFKKLISYGIVGVIGTIVHFLTLVLLVELLSINPVIGSLFGFILTVLLSYFLNKKYTFRIQVNQGSNYFIKYTAVSIIGFVMNFFIMYLTVTVLSIHYAIGQLIVIICIPVTNFLLNNYWTFKTAE